MFKNRHCCTSTLLAALSMTGYVTAAHADENPSGFYIGAGVGQFDTKVDRLEGVTDAVRDTFDHIDDTSWKLFVGWRFMKWLAIEADYVDLGKPRGDFGASGTDGDYTVELAGFAPYVVGTLPIGMFELSGRVGYYWHDLKIDVDLNNIGPGNGDVFGSDESSEAWVYGVGAGVTFLEHINARLEYERYDVEKVDKSEVVWLTGEWRF